MGAARSLGLAGLAALCVACADKVVYLAPPPVASASVIYGWRSGVVRLEANEGAPLALELSAVDEGMLYAVGYWQSLRALELSAGPQVLSNDLSTTRGLPPTPLGVFVAELGAQDASWVKIEAPPPWFSEVRLPLREQRCAHFTSTPRADVDQIFQGHPFSFTRRLPDGRVLVASNRTMSLVDEAGSTPISSSSTVAFHDLLVDNFPDRVWLAGGGQVWGASLSGSQLVGLANWSPRAEAPGWSVLAGGLVGQATELYALSAGGRIARSGAVSFGSVARVDASIDEAAWVGPEEMYFLGLDHGDDRVHVYHLLRATISDESLDPTLEPTAIALTPAGLIVGTTDGTLLVRRGEGWVALRAPTFFHLHDIEPYGDGFLAFDASGTLSQYSERLGFCPDIAASASATFAGISVSGEHVYIAGNAGPDEQRLTMLTRVE